MERVTIYKPNGINITYTEGSETVFICPNNPPKDGSTRAEETKTLPAKVSQINIDTMGATTVVTIRLVAERMNFIQHTGMPYDRRVVA